MVPMTGYPIHPQRFSLSNVQRDKRLIVVHTSEGSEGGWKQLISFMAMPGDRIVPGSDPPRRFGASYQGVTVRDDASYRMADDPLPKGCYAASGANKDSLHICMPGKAAKTRAQWLGEARNDIRAVARFIVDNAPAHGIPMIRLTPAQVKAGQSGYCGHWDVTQAYGLSDHTDPRENFPWDVLAQDIAELLEPEDDMITVLDEPIRQLDTRLGGGSPLLGGVTHRLEGISLGTAAFINVTVVPVGKGGWLSVWAGDGDDHSPADPPVFSNVNWDADSPPQTNSAWVKLGAAGSIKVFSTVDVHVIVDLQAAR